jgi:hypothetical protein
MRLFAGTSGSRLVAGNLLCNRQQNSVASKRNGAYAHDIQPSEVGLDFCIWGTIEARNLLS